MNRSVDPEFEPGRPWHREPWPWIIIGLLGTVILASLATLWIAATNPDTLVVEGDEYREIQGRLRAQDAAPGAEAGAPAPPAADGEAAIDPDRD